MRAPLTELFHLLVTLPAWVFAALVAATVWAWRGPAGSRRRRWRYAWLAGTALFYVGSIPVTHSWLEAWIENRHPVPAVGAADRGDDNLILVLTGGWLRSTPEGWEQKIGESGWERTAAAVALWRRIGGRVLFTGAPTPDGRDSAAAKMGRIAVAMGLPPEVVLVEPASRTTRENLLFSKRLLGGRPGRVWLVTSAMHMPRSVVAAREAGVDVTPYPVDFRADSRLTWRMLLPDNSARGALEGALHEIAGILAYRARALSAGATSAGAR